MNENTKRYYFSLIKLCFIILLITYFVYNSKRSLHEISVEWFLLAIVLAAAIGYELISTSVETLGVESRLFGVIKNKRKFIFLLIEAGFTLLLFLFFKESKNQSSFLGWSHIFLIAPASLKEIIEWFVRPIFIIPL